MTSPPPSLPPPPPPAAPPSQPSEGVRVRCAGCRMILTVPPGLTEFACPNCRMPQMLPPEPMPRAHKKARSVSRNKSGIDPSKMQLPCASCKAILNVPYGLSRFSCPQCRFDLAVDLSKVKKFFW